MSLDHLLREQNDDLLLEDGGWILLESATNPSVRVRIEDMSGPLVALLEQSGWLVRLEEGSASLVAVVEASEGTP